MYLFKGLLLMKSQTLSSCCSTMCGDLQAVRSRPEIQTEFWSYPSGEYSRLNTAPWVWVLRLTDSTAGFIELYKLVIVLKLSRAGSTNSPRLIVLLRSHENRLSPRLPPLPLCGLSAAEQRGSSFSAAGDPALFSGWSSLLPGGAGETLLALSSDSSISGSSSLSETVPVLSGLSWDSSASSLSLWCSELIVETSVSEQPRRCFGSSLSAQRGRIMACFGSFLRWHGGGAL